MSNSRALKLGPTKQLSREDAIEQYIVLRMRTEEINRLDYLLQGFKSGSLKLPTDAPFQSADLADTLRTVFFGWFATLADRDSRAAYAFDCLYKLFPSQANRIAQCQISLEGCYPELREFRNNVAFHATKEIANHIKARLGLRGTDAFLDLCSAIRSFEQLMKELEKEEPSAIPEFSDMLKRFQVAHLPAFIRLVEAKKPSQAVPATIDALDSCALIPGR